MRSTHSHSNFFEYKTYTWSSNEWVKRFAVISNIGIFIFEAKNHKARPSFYNWHNTIIQRLPASERLDERGNLFTMTNADEEVITFSIASRDDYIVFNKVAIEMQKHFSRTKNILAEKFVQD